MRIRAYVSKSLILLLVLFGTIACGYRLSGIGALVPKEARTISIPVFVNATNEPYVDMEVTQAVTDEFIADGRLRVTDPESADLVLRGQVVKYEVRPLSYTDVTYYVQQYGIHLTVDASLEDRKTKKILWQEKGIKTGSLTDYPIFYDSAGANIKQTKINKVAAIRKASQDLARTLRSRVLEGF